MKQRLDKAIVQKGLVSTRSQAESWIRLGKVTVDGEVIDKAGYFVNDRQAIELKTSERYVSRAGLKLASVAEALGLDFRDKIVLDVGSSTGGFTDYALQHGAKKVYAVDVGTDQLHPSLRSDPRIELHEKTDIRDFKVNDSRSSKLDARKAGQTSASNVEPQASSIDIVLIDVSFISLRQIMPHVSRITTHDSNVIAMVKPQFEAGRYQISKGVVKNDSIRRRVLKDFELWVKDLFVIVNKADSDVAGMKGNRERFYLLQLASRPSKP